MKTMGAFIILILIIGLSLTSLPIYYVIRNYNNNKPTLFKGRVSKIRSRFLHDVFDLTVDDYKLLHFDGYTFHFRERYSYKEFSSVYRSESISTKVTDARIPHHAAWRHRRVNGGPDRRYSYNPRIMTSYICNVYFEGEVSYKLSTYCLGNYSVDETLDKITKLFESSNIINVETVFAEYSVIFEKAKKAHHILTHSKSEKKRINSMLRELRQLPSNLLSDDTDLLGKQKNAIKKRDQMNTDIVHSQEQFDKAINEMNSLVKNARARLDMQKIKSYNI